MLTMSGSICAQSGPLSMAIRRLASPRSKRVNAVAAWKQNAGSILSSVIEDSKREFGPFSRIGFGLDGTEEEKNSDFAAVRGPSRRTVL